VGWGGGGQQYARKKACSFLKKRTKKLLEIGVRRLKGLHYNHRETPNPQHVGA
jgi:hypothetical protein